MHSNNSNKLKNTRSGSVNVNTSDQRYKTIADTYFNRDRQSAFTPKDIENLQNHYRFHKGTTYSIGNDKKLKAGISAA